MDAEADFSARVGVALGARVDAAECAMERGRGGERCERSWENAPRNRASSGVLAELGR